MRDPGSGKGKGWIVAGCGLILLVTFSAVFWAVCSVKRMKTRLTDPVARTSEALEILGMEDLPDGYGAMFSIRVPLVVEIVILSDGVPLQDGTVDGFERAGLMYVKSLWRGEGDEELRKVFDRGMSMEDLLAHFRFRGPGFTVQPEREVAGGVIRSGAVPIRFVSDAATVRTSEGRSIEALTTLFLVECPDDQSMRLGLWFEKGRPTLADDGAEVFQGTVADPERIESFTAGIAFCP